MLSFDLDRFKPVNDNLGVRLHDDVLVDHARRLPACVRGEDVVARLSGPRRTKTALLTLFGIVAVGLAAMAVYG